MHGNKSQNPAKGVPHVQVTTLALSGIADLASHPSIDVRLDMQQGRLADFDNGGRPSL